MTTKKVYFWKTVFDGSGTTFDQVLLNSETRAAIYAKGNKVVEVRHIDFNKSLDFITGIVVSTKTHDVPPKSDIGQDQYYPIDLKEGQGLAYGNAFLYHIPTQVLAFEFNKFGATVKTLAELFNIHVSGKGGLPRFIVGFDSLLTEDTYRKVLDLDLIKKFEFNVTNPTAIVNELQDSVSLSNCASVAKAANAKQMNIVLTSDAKMGGIRRGFFSEIWEHVNTLLSLGSIKKVKVHGSKETDGEDIVETIDLFLDRLKSSFDLETLEINSDVQVYPRKQGIQDSFLPMLTQIEAILGRIDGQATVNRP